GEQVSNRISHWIDGKSYSGVVERSGEVFNPATGEVSGQVDFAGETEVDAAVGAAARAFPGWRDTSLSRRTQVLFRMRELLAQRAGELAAIVTAEHGKVASDAAGEVQRALENVEYACGAPQLLKGEISENAS